MGNTAAATSEPTGRQTPAERLVLELTRDLLRKPGATLEDGFIELGGSSLTASELLVLVHDRTGVRIPALELYRAPNLRAVARLVSDPL